MRYALNGILLSVRIVIGRINWPRISRLMVFGVPDSVQDRVPQIDIGLSHIDLGAQYPLPVGKFARSHSQKQIPVFVD